MVPPARLVCLLLSLAVAGCAPSPSPSPPPDNRPCFSDKTFPAHYTFNFCSPLVASQGQCASPAVGGPQAADGSCGCGLLGCSALAVVSNVTISISIWATTTSNCAISPTYVFYAVPLTGTYVAATSGGGFASASLASAQRTVHDWCNAANSEGSNSCKKCSKLTHRQVVIALSVTLPTVFVLVVTMWWGGCCCCPPPPNSFGARMRARRKAAMGQGIGQAYVEPSGMVGFGNGAPMPPGGVQMGQVYNAQGGAQMFTPAPGALYYQPQQAGQRAVGVSYAPVSHGIGQPQPGMVQGYAAPR